MLSSIIAILAGMTLLARWLKRGAARFARSLAQFDVVIGVLAILVGVLELLSLEGILLIVAGLVLAATGLSSIPAIGRPLARLGHALEPFRLIIGVLVLLDGIFNLLSAILHL